MGSRKEKHVLEEMMKKDSELFKPLVAKAERYLRDYCNGEQNDDEKAKIALRVLSVYRKILKVEKERAEIKSEWKKLMAGVTELKHLKGSRGKQKQSKTVKVIKPKPS
jgi:hypothetical protein